MTDKACVSHGVGLLNCYGGVELLNSAMGGGAAQLLWRVELLNWIKAASSPKPVTIKAEIKIKIDSRVMANSVAHDNCTPISRNRGLATSINTTVMLEECGQEFRQTSCAPACTYTYSYCTNSL